MTDEETSAPQRIAALEARVAHLEADLAETSARKAELLEQNQALRLQVDERTMALLDSDAALAIEADLRAEVVRLSEQVANLEPLREDRERLQGGWAETAQKLMMSELREADLRGLVRRLYDIATWAASCTPDTLAETFGDTSADLKRAEALLRDA